MSEKCEHLNEDGTFKGGFDGCVLHMQSSCGGSHSEESAKKICGSIAQQVGASSMKVDQVKAALEAEQPRKENGMYHGAAAATAEAYEASEDAYDPDNDGDADMHEKAADLHDKAAKLHKAAGNDAMASKHKAKAAEHREKMEAMKKPPELPIAAEGAQPSTLASQTSHLQLEGGFAFEAPTPTTFEKFMVMAGGVQTITLGCKGNPLQITINVTPDSARALQRQLDAVNSSGKQKAFNCFDHEKKAASSWPKRYFWSDDPAPGVYEAAEPSKAGLEAIEGKTYRGFSMTFFSDAEITPRPAVKGGGCEIKAGAKGSPENPANIICPLESGDDPSPYLNMGTMTNRPAFTENEPLFAAQPGAGSRSNSPATASAEAARNAGAHPRKQNQDTMQKQQPDAAALQERCTQLEASIAELTAKNDAASRDKLTVVEAELEAAQAKLELAKEKEKTVALEAAQTAQKEKEADAAVETMVNNGVIPTLDKELRASYREKFIKDPTLIPLMTAMKGTIANGRKTPGATGLTAGRPVFGFGDAHEGALNVLRSMASLCKRQAPLQGLDASSCEQRGIIAREMAVIYRNEIRGKHMELDAQKQPRPSMNPDFIMAPLEAAADSDTLGTLAGTLVTQRFLDIFMYKLPLITNGKIMTDFSDIPSDLSQAVSTRKITVPAPVAYDPTIQADGFPNGWIPTAAPTTVDVNITMDELIGTPIQFDLAALSKTQRQLFAEQAPAAAYANALYLMKKIYNICTPANFNSYAAITAADANGIVKVPIAYPTYPVAQIDFARSKLAEIAAAFDANEVPDEDRSVLLNAGYYNKATTDPSLVTFFAGQQAPEIVTQGNLPDLAGFVPIKAPNFPAANNGVGIALQKNGLLVKTRLPANLNTIQPGAGNGTVTQIVHPDTGVSMMVVLWTDHRRGYSAWLPCFIIGAAKGDTRAGLVITSQ